MIEQNKVVMSRGSAANEWYSQATLSVVVSRRVRWRRDSFRTRTSGRHLTLEVRSSNENKRDTKGCPNMGN
jgi:hypothetical protein